MAFPDSLPAKSLYLTDTFIPASFNSLFKFKALSFSVSPFNINSLPFILILSSLFIPVDKTILAAFAVVPVIV